MSLNLKTLKNILLSIITMSFSQAYAGAPTLSYVQVKADYLYSNEFNNVYGIPTTPSRIKPLDAFEPSFMVGAEAQFEPISNVLIRGYYETALNGSFESDFQVGAGFYYPISYGLLLQGIASTGSIAFKQHSSINFTDIKTSVSRDYQTLRLGVTSILGADSIYNIGIIQNTYSGGSHMSYYWDIATSDSSAMNPLESSGSFTNTGFGYKFGLEFSTAGDISRFITLGIGYNF